MPDISAKRPGSWERTRTYRCSGSSSGMIHRDKPDPALFRWVEEQLQVAQGDVIWYVGDSYEADVIGAHDAGWRSIWSQAYLPQKQLSVNGIIDRVAVDLDELREQLIAVLKGEEWDEMCRKR
ncbi:MAG: HAD family hydrolase [Merdibacter sp.]